MFIVSAVYDFARSLLQTPDRKFVLCLPPRTKLVDPSITLFKAGLSPASNVLFGWIEAGEKGQALKKEILDQRQEMAASPLSSPAAAESSSSSSNTNTEKPKTKTVPKWLQKGLFNKK